MTTTSEYYAPYPVGLKVRMVKDPGVHFKKSPYPWPNTKLNKLGFVVRVGRIDSERRPHFGWENTRGTIEFSEIPGFWIPVECFAPEYDNNF